MARIHEGPKRLENLRDMRLEALRLMRKLARFRPRLIGSVWTGHVRTGSDIDIHIFSDSSRSSPTPSTSWPCRTRSSRSGSSSTARSGSSPTSTSTIDSHFELTLYPEDKAHYVFKSSITGKAIERASIAELEELLKAEYPELDLDDEVERLEEQIDRFVLFRMLLEPLEGVKQSQKYHPEGDALYHSLQVFELAREERPYDEEFLLAALLHDVGKAIDPSDHVAAGLAGPGGGDHRAHGLADRAPHGGARLSRRDARGPGARRGSSSPRSYDDLMLLHELDRNGRVPGASVCELDEALDYIRGLAAGEAA